MIFSPNKFERYTAALRESLQLAAAKHGKSRRQLEALRKIYTFEAVYFKNEMYPVNISELSSRLLSAVYVKKLEKDEKFKFKVKSVGGYLINPKLFTAVLLTVCKYAQVVSVDLFNGQPSIYCKSKNTAYTAKALKIFGVQYITEIMSGECAVLFSCVATSKHTEAPFADLRELTSPFSPIDMFL